MLSDTEKQFLLKIARHSIEAAVNERAIPRSEILHPVLNEHCGAFVTLHERQELRGCIGYVDPIKPLWETVQEAAVKAAMDDPRFIPVQREEIPFLEIEISVLSTLTEITAPDEINIGRDGLVVELGYYRGLLLPQVAASMHWDAETFLEQTFRKSGIPHHMWHHKNVKIFTFTAEVFSEAEEPVG